MKAIPVLVQYLIPEEPCPCDLFFHFRGKYVLALEQDSIMDFSFLEKIHKAQYKFIYIKNESLERWTLWEKNRHPSANSTHQIQKEKEEESEEKIYGNKRAEILSYLQKSIQCKNPNDASFSNIYKKIITKIQKLIQSKTWDWYFHQFHEPPDLFHHNARVAFSIALFSSVNSLLSEKELDDIIQSTFIHELNGDPINNLKTVVSEQTLKTLEDRKHPISEPVIELIRLHDELVSGTGFPKNKKKDEIPPAIRIFSLFNHFDHYRLKFTGTRRARFDATKDQMEKRRSDYDSQYWKLFWDFWEKHIEITA